MEKIGIKNTDIKSIPLYSGGPCEPSNEGVEIQTSKHFEREYMESMIRYYCDLERACENIRATIMYGLNFSSPSNRTKILGNIISTEAQIDGAEYSLNENIFRLLVPERVPARNLYRCSYSEKFHDQVEYLLGKALKEIAEEDLLSFKKGIQNNAVVVVNQLTSVRDRIKDPDNSNIKHAIDLLVQYGFLVSDIGSYLSLYKTGTGDVQQNKSNTEILVMSKNAFIKYLMPKS